MKVVILAGGYGTRISEESVIKPKPMINIGNMPILLHIMKYYYSQGFNEFIICAGYKQEFIKQYFDNYLVNNCNIQFDFTNSFKKTFLDDSNVEKWKISVIDTGINTQTAGRLLKIKKYLNNDENFFFTYGDGLSDVNLNNLLKFHLKNKAICTLTSVSKQERFGTLTLNDEKITDFSEKKMNGGWINAGFMVLNKKIFDYLSSDLESFEFDILPKLVLSNSLYAFKHNGFWKCMDTLKDKNELEKIWEEKEAKWKIW